MNVLDLICIMVFSILFVLWCSRSYLYFRQNSLSLYDDVVASDTFIEYLSTKIVIRLTKKSGKHWASLEKSSEEVDVKTVEVLDTPTAPAAFSSKRWDDILKDEEEDKLEGDAALNKVFQVWMDVKCDISPAEYRCSFFLPFFAGPKILFSPSFYNFLNIILFPLKDIYGRGSDEQRKAMIKSFTESGGTVLSTNWVTSTNASIPFFFFFFFFSFFFISFSFSYSFLFDAFQENV